MVATTIQRQPALAQLKRSTFARIVFGVLWWFAIELVSTIVIAIFLGVLAGRDASAGRAASVAFGEAYGLLHFFATGILTGLLSLGQVLPGTAKFNTAHRCPECLSPAWFDPRVAGRNIFGKWTCQRCGIQLRVNRVHLVGSAIIVLVVSNLLFFALHIPGRGIVSLVMATAPFRLYAMAAGVKRAH